jgi:type I restriction enzyme S subunit
LKQCWIPTQLGDLLNTVSRPVVVQPTEEYRLLGVRLNGAGPFLREVKLGSQIAAGTLYMVEEEDFVYSRLFAWRGAFGVIGRDLSQSFVSNEFPLFQPRDNKIDVRFLCYWFRLPSSLRWVASDCSGSTPLTRNRYKEEYFLALKIPIPTLFEQRRIVSKIEHLSTKIEMGRGLHKDICRTSSAMLRSVFRDTVENAERVPIKEVAPLVRRPVDVQIDKAYPELGIRSFGNGTFHKPALAGSEVGTKKLYRIQPGDLIFNNVFAWEGAVAVAQPEDAGRVGSHRFITREPDLERVTADFLRFYFLTQEGLKKLGEASPGGAGRNRTLGLKKLDAIQVPVPPLGQQRWFDSLQMKVREAKAFQKKTAAELDALLPSILDKAFKGEL